MDEERAYEIALRIRDEFEDLLDEKNIMIPSADRGGVPGEARLYGEENSRLVDSIVQLLIKHVDEITLQGDIDDAGHPLRELAILACEEFEDLLDDKNIMIPSVDREGREEEACLYGSEYYGLEDAVVSILMEELAAGTKPEDAAEKSAEAGAAVEEMQKAMAAAPEGLAAVGPAKMRGRKALARPKPRRGTTAPLR